MEISSSVGSPNFADVTSPKQDELKMTQQQQQELSSRAEVQSAPQNEEQARRASPDARLGASIDTYA